MLLDVEKREAQPRSFFQGLADTRGELRMLSRKKP
jgi:hypothetical protein